MLALFLALQVARADVPPPNGYVEDCTVQRQQQKGEECQACKAWYGGREDCVALEGQGYVSRCRTRGASVWGEVLCRPASAAPPLPPAPVGPAIPEVPGSTPTIPEVPANPATPAPAPPEPGRCATTGTSDLAPLFLAALLARRRRRP